MSADRIWLLLSRKDNGDITSEELAELEVLLQDNPSVNITRPFIEEIWKKGITAVEQPLDAKAHWESIKRRLQEGQPADRGSRRRIYQRVLAAAGLALILGSGALLYLHFYTGDKGRPDMKSFNQVSTQPGSRSKIILPDGTKVWLNAGSVLSYADFKNGQAREVRLEGEAFFEVVHDARHPFIIHTSHVDIKDIGTSFEVKAYPGAKTIEATLISGAIEIISHDDPERRIELKPDEKIVIPLPDLRQRVPGTVMPDSGTTTRYTIAKVKRDRHGLLPQTAWVQNKLVFDNEPFEELALRMEKWYNVEICFSDEAVKRMKFSGVIEKETIEQALKAMQFSCPFQYRMTGNKIWISG